MTRQSSMRACAAGYEVRRGMQGRSHCPGLAPSSFRISARARLVLVSICLCSLFVASSPVLSQTAATESGQIRAHVAKGQAALQANEPSQAEAEFRAALALDPKSVEALANLGMIAFVRDDCERAVSQLHGALKLNPTLTKAKALIAICEKRMGSASARVDLESAFTSLTDSKLRIQVGVELADLYYESGDLDHTLPVVHSLVQADPDNVDLLFFAQRVYSEMADATMNKLALLAPDSARMQQLIAERLINEGDLKGAVEHYRNAIAADPRLPGMHFELAEAILQGTNNAGALEQARLQLDAAVKMDGDSSKVECAYGRIALSQGRTDEALRHYQRAHALNPKEVEAQLGLARVLADENKPQEALAHMRAAVQADPMNAVAHYRLARLCHSLHLTDEEQKEIKLYQQVRKAKDRIVQLYRQMNRAPGTQDELPPEGQP